MYFSHCIRIEIKQINMCSYLIQSCLDLVHSGTFNEWHSWCTLSLYRKLTSSVRPFATSWCLFCLFGTVSIHVVPLIWGAQRLSMIHLHTHLTSQDLQVHSASIWMNSMRIVHISTFDYDWWRFTRMLSHHNLFHLASTSALAIPTSLCPWRCCQPLRKLVTRTWRKASPGASSCTTHISSGKTSSPRQEESHRMPATFKTTRRRSEL